MCYIYNRKLNASIIDMLLRILQCAYPVRTDLQLETHEGAVFYTTNELLEIQYA